MIVDVKPALYIRLTWTLQSRSGACLRTIEAGYGLCAIFAPGNRHAVVGTKEGALDIIDVGASTRLESLQAHSGAVWSLAALPDNRCVLIIMQAVVAGKLCAGMMLLVLRLGVSATCKMCICAGTCLG